MQCNQAGLNIIKNYESCRLESYSDQKGICTIGWGQTGPWVTNGLTCTQQQADMWLSQTVDQVSAALSRMIKNIININQFSALVSLAYNIGTGEFSSSSSLALVNSGQINLVPHAISLWNEIEVDGKKVIDQGLVNRRNAEVELFNTPVEEN